MHVYETHFQAGNIISPNTVLCLAEDGGDARTQMTKIARGIAGDPVWRLNTRRIGIPADHFGETLVKALHLKGPHVKADMACPDCKHPWGAIWPIGTETLQCPACQQTHPIAHDL